MKNKVSQPHGETERHHGHGKVGDEPFHWNLNSTQLPAKQACQAENRSRNQNYPDQKEQGNDNRSLQIEEETGTIQESCDRSNHPGGVRQGTKDKDQYEHCKIKSGGKWADRGARLSGPEIL